MASLRRLIGLTCNNPTTPQLPIQCLRFKCSTAGALTPATVSVTLCRKYRYTVAKSIQTNCVRNVATTTSVSAYRQTFANHHILSTLYPQTNNLYSKELLTQLQLAQLQQQLQKRIFSRFSPQNVPHRKTSIMKQNNMEATDKQHRPQLCCRQITKNLTLYTNKPMKSDIDPKTLEIKQPTGNPLVLIMAWLMARQKNLRKYAEIYAEMGFDALIVHVTPWQLLWPTKGTQIVAADTLKFLENNKSYEPIVMHGFSVGAYQFGEMMLMMSADMPRYTPILDRFICQVWDSAADITEIPVGLPKSIFPNNPGMQNALRSYTLYHMKTFYNQATIHYVRSSQMFHSTLLKAPAIFFVSENDAVGPPSSNQAVREDWERANISVTFKCWERSVHAAHLIKHRTEYLEYLYKHLEETGVLTAVNLKKRAKL